MDTYRSPHQHRAVWLASHAGGVWVPRVGEELRYVRWGVGADGNYTVWVHLVGRATVEANWSSREQDCARECDRFRQEWHGYVEPVWVAGSRAGIYLGRGDVLIRAYVRRRNVRHHVLVLQLAGGQHEVSWGSDRARADEECARIRRVFGLLGEGYAA
jgi:hypothetical protein